MALGSQLPVRLPPDLDARLQAVAERIGTTKSALIRMLAKTFVDQVVDPDGNVQLPPKWRQLLDVADGRAKGYGRWPGQRAAAGQFNEKPKRTKPASSKE